MARYRAPRRSPALLPTLFAALIWLAIAALCYFWFGLKPYPAWLAGGTIATALLFASDKMLSKGAGRRVPEVVLLGLVLLGGVLGGWFGMLVVRHKTRHTQFWVVQWVASAIHLALVWFLILQQRYL